MSVIGLPAMPTTHFDSPDDHTATEPPERRGLRRDGVRLLVAEHGRIAHTRFDQLGDHLRPGDVLVINTSATLPGQLDAFRDGRRVVVHVANRLPTTVWAGCEPPVFVDVPDHRTEVLGLELACADHLSEVPWILVERGGDICHELEEVGREYEADAIVVGSTHGIVGRIFGSVAGRLAKRAKRPVVVIP